MVSLSFIRHHPTAPEGRRPHLRQHVGQRRPEDGGDHHVRAGGCRAGLHHADGAEEEEEGAEAQEAPRCDARNDLVVTF